MAGEDRKATESLSLFERLEAEPFRFDFFQALRRLECAHPDRPRIGHSTRLAEDYLRLGQEPSLTFAPAALAAFRRVPDKPSRLSGLFFGLFGPQGALPLHLTVYARERARDFGDRTFAHFADLFHHRMLSFFYRAWAAGQPAVALDRPETDRFAVYLGALFGMALPSTRGRDAVPDLTKLHFAGLLSSQTRHADGLRALLAEFFQLPVEIHEFVGAWMELPETWWCRLGSSQETGTLGRTLSVGARVWECQNKFRVVLGPLTREDYESFLPGSPRLSTLLAAVRNYTNDQWAFDIRLALRRDETPPLVLGGRSRLGLATWVVAATPETDPADLVIEPEPVSKEN